MNTGGCLAGEAGECRGLVTRSVGKRRGSDLSKGLCGALADRSVGIGHSICKRRDGTDRLRTELAEGRRRIPPEFWILALQIRKDGRDRNLRRCLERAEGCDCVPLSSWVVSVAEAVGKRRDRCLCSVSEVWHRGDSSDGVEAKARVDVRDKCEQGRQSDWAKFAQTPERPDPVRVRIHKPIQIVKGWRCSCPQRGEGCNGPTGKLLGPSIDNEVGKLTCEWKSGMTEFIRKRALPCRGIVMRKPFHQEGNRRDADVVDGVCRFVVFEIEIKPYNPVAEGMPLVGGLAGGWLECDERNKGKPRAKEAGEKRSLLSHTESMPWTEADERAN